MEAGGSIQAGDQPTQCPTRRGFQPLPKIVWRHSWRDTVTGFVRIRYGLSTTVCFDARGGKNGMVVQFEPAQGTSHGYPAAYITPSVSEFPHIQIFIYVKHYDSTLLNHGQ